jgi:hypothetical protein
VKFLVSSVCLLLTVVPCSASKPKPYFREYRLIDTITESAKSESDNGQSLKYLEQLADGAAPEPDPATVKSLGFSAETLRLLSLRAPDVRAYAFLAIGTVGGPEAVKFLSAKTRADFDPATPELGLGCRGGLQPGSGVNSSVRPRVNQEEGSLTARGIRC